MGKHFKLRLSKVVLPIFQSCKSKDPSKLPENPLPLLLHLPLLRRPKSNTIDHDNVNDFPGFATCTLSPLPLKPHHHRQQPSLKQQVSSAILSVGCNCRSKSSNTNEEEGDEFRWKIDTKWHVIDKINDDTTPRRKIYSHHYDSEEDDEEEEEDLCNNNQASPLFTKIKKTKKRSKKNKIRSRVSTSSGDSGWFSSEEEEDQENEAQVSYSSDFFETHLKTIRESPLNDDSSSIKRSNVKKTKKKKSTATHAARDQNVKRYNHNKRGVILYSSSSSTGTESSPARLSAFQRLMRSSSNSTCKAEGKVKESFAVVKKSEDPYQDFRKSMMEMILEKQMFESKDLEQLLHCLLSLNSKHHHPIIIRAFSEIWEFLFCSSSSL
ncbi:hypothetical protein C5167_041924 [Papaver somniferum]|uniref:transcription repressor OFP7-like n=1 Tax=Papaver somniferum TaxID=3469 RepID=UPI000E6F59AC|nr:transcription repressor OFP7-like [Papaver somniferum]RZC86994.1 hypothetical protein C5167_041924 [Papaver somniferum]